MRWHRSRTSVCAPSAAAAAARFGKVRHEERRWKAPVANDDRFRDERVAMDLAAVSFRVGLRELVNSEV
jgi:hypothetical protein